MADANANSVIKDSHILFIDRYMFSLRIYKYSLGNVTTEILKVVQKCKICYKGITEAGGPGI